jgi:putative ABC transport system permease protein
MRSLISHLRYTVRRLLKSPGFTVTAVLILGLGIGANTAIFSLVNCVLLKPLPYPNPDRLVSIYQIIQGGDQSQFDYPDYLDLRANQRTMDSLTAFYPDDFTLTGRGEPERISGIYASGSLFKVLGRPFLIGKPFGETEDNSETRSVVVMSEHLWNTKFQRDPRVLGANLLLNGRSFEIVGVTPAQANELGKVDLYVPLNQGVFFNAAKEERSEHFLWGIGRMKENVSLRQAQANFETISQELARQYPVSNTGKGVHLVPYLDSVVNDYSASLWLLEGAVGCLLFITCANVANLLVIRVRERRRELSIRAALGASRTELIVQTIFETSMLALAGGILGLPLAAWAVALIRSLSPEDITRFQEVALDNASLAFVLATTVCTTLLAGVLPAWLGSEIDLGQSLSEGAERGRTAGPRRQKKQSFLVAGQVALTFLLLTAAGLLTRSYDALQKQPLGFNARRVLTGEIHLPDSRYSNQTKCTAAFDEILNKLHRLPGVTGVALNDDMPFKGISAWSIFGIGGQPDPKPGKEPLSEHQVVSPDYFSVLGMPLVRGRGFTDRDQDDTEKVAIVSESLARKFFPGQDPIGKQLHDFSERHGRKRKFYTIVGVVPDAEHASPETPSPQFQIYYPYSQQRSDLSPLNAGTLVLSMGSDTNAAIPLIRKTIASVDPDLTFSNVATLGELVEKGFATRHLSMLVVSLFSGAALLLAAVGLYGVLSYSVNQRKRELGIRVAVGAQPGNIFRLVITQGLRIGAVGLVVGLAGALIFGHFIQAALYQVPSTDPTILIAAAAVLWLTALMACLFPALRATRVDPIQALRE